VTNVWNSPFSPQGSIPCGIAATKAASNLSPAQLAGEFAGREFDADLLRDLPSDVDPCGENGEFHTFVYAGPGLREPVPHERGPLVVRDGRFVYCDLVETASR